MYGIDISEHNGNIDLNQYKDQFVIIRAGYGFNTVDKKFKRNVEECIRLGIPFGFYWYSYALNKTDAVTEAAFFIKTIAPYKDKIRVGVWLDMEDADHYKINHGLAIKHDTIAPISKAFAEKVEAAGYYSGIYTSKSWLPYLAPECDRFDKWVASWGPVNNGQINDDTRKYGTILQFTSKPLDRDLMYVDISHYTGGEKTESKPTTKPASNPLDQYTDEQLADQVLAGKYGNGDDRKKALGSRYDAVQKIVNKKLEAAKAVYYYVRSGDNLTKIAKMYGTTVDNLVKMNGIKNPNLIYAGQRIRVK